MGGEAARVSGEDVLARLALGTHERPAALGRYDVVGRLGSGGMGTVYDAIDRERGTRVAIKTISVADVSLGVHLKREFRAVADLAHPNLAAVYELGWEDGLWFFAMEHVDGVHFTSWARGAATGDNTVRTPTVSRDVTIDLHGQTTREFVSFDDDHSAEQPKVSAPSRTSDSIRRAFAELCRGLSALHGAGLWHGDIKPANVLVRPDGGVVVVDFGLARPVFEGRAGQGPMPGTPLFMSPEQLAGERAGPPSDWHAVGAMLYEVLTGWPPFRGGSLLDLYFKKSHDVPPTPRELVPETPEDLSDLCMALLRPEPELRPSGAEILRVLEPARSDEQKAPSDFALRSFFVGRQHELSALEQAYRRARGGRRTVAHVQGASGIGKSAIVRRFLRGVHSVERARVFRGRCYERESVPYKAFDGIVDDLGELLRGQPVLVEALVPQYVGELVRVFPALLAVPAFAVHARNATLAHEARELRRRAWIALWQLLAALGRSRPVVLSIDDLHWADADSVALLEALQRNSGDARLLVVASYRPEEASRNPALANHFAACRSLGGGYVEVPIGELPLREAERLARAALQSLNVPVSDSRVSSLAEEAGGVPFFVEELARFVASHPRDEELPHISLERAIAARVRALPIEQRALVEVVAVADTPVPQSLVFEAASLDAGALPALLALRSASMLGWNGASGDDLVSTYHDRIRESVLASMSEHARAERHLALGRALRARHAREEMGPWVFATVRHLGAAASLIADPKERRETARLHLQAGRLARSAAAFPLAFRCFEGGIALLGEDAWESDYDLALGLFTGAAEAAYLTADWAVLDARVATVKARGRSVMDQLLAWELAIDAQIGRHEYVGAIETACEVLGLLGFELVADPDQAAVGAAFQRALSCLEKVGPSGLAELKDVDDAKTAAAMRIHIRVSPAAYFGRPLLLPVIASNLIVTSVDRGLSPATPYALALFGIVLNTVGMYPQAHAWGQLAVRLIPRWEDRSLEAATRHVVFNLVCPWMVPMHTILGPLREVFDIGRRIGDFEYASYAAHGYVHHAMYAARPLAPLLREAHELGDQMRALGQVNAVHVHEPFEQLLECLTGNVENPAHLNDSTFDEEALLTRAAAEGSRSGIFVIRLVMGLARFWFGEIVEANACFDIARSYADAAPSVWHQPILHQHGALAACAAWELTKESDRPALRATIDASLAALRTLAGHSPVNFAHRVSMIEAEIARIEGRPKEAHAKLDEAICLAGEAHYDNDIAIAHELAGRFAIARDLYAKWGATAKAKQLEERLRSK